MTEKANNSIQVVEAEEEDGDDDDDEKEILNQT